jgi:flagellar motor protein MotB
MLLAAAAVLLGCQGLQTAQQHTYQQQLLAQQRANYELQQRINELNLTNEEMNRLVGQSQQQVQMLHETNEALREQLRSTTEQVARLKEESQAREQRIEMLTASLQRRGGAIIPPNNSLQSELPAMEIPGIDARRDGDTIRIAIPAAQLFEEGDSRLRADAGPVLERLADHLARIYPQQRIVVEGHVDRNPATSPPEPPPHQVTLARAAAVFDYLVRHTRLTADQLSIAGHGGNQPRYSNATEMGRQRNRRIELVVLPEKVDGRKP